LAKGPCEVLSLLCVRHIWQLAFSISIYFSQTSGPIRTKLGRNVSWVVKENDRTHVIKVVVLVVKITIQLTYGIYGFKKKSEGAYNYEII
jgi:hypothetical protein